MLVVALVGPPGAGKTALIEATAKQLRGRARVAAVVVNPAADRDASRLFRYCDQVVPVETATPGATHVRDAMLNLGLHDVDVLFIESMGGIAGAPAFGQDVTVTALSVTGGDDKAAEYHSLLEQSDLLLLSKSELQRHVDFDRKAFRDDAAHINPDIEMFEVSAFANTGMEQWFAWIERLLVEKNPQCGRCHVERLPEWFFA